MATIRIMPPAAGGRLLVNGRTYTCAAGSVVDAPEHDAAILSANGWTVVAEGGVGATSARPATPKRGSKFHDSTVGKTIVFDGAVWRDSDSGAAV